jgi:putative NADH-flavin reductase
MTIGILGANGKTGVLVVEEAIRRGHKVVAGVRGSNSFIESDFLEIVQCDVLNTDQVQSLVAKSDVVISVIGHVKGSPEFVQSEGITNVIKSMNNEKKNRLISLTGTGVRFPNDKITIMDRILNLAIGIIDPKRIADGKKHVDIIKKSNTNWTVLRVLKLSNGEAKKFKLSPKGPTKVYVSRSEVAIALLDIVEKEIFIREAPIISKV